jgi:hypothetical protein
MKVRVFLGGAAAAVLSVLASAARGVEGAGPPDPFARAKALVEAGQAAEALQALEALAADLPPDARLSRWELDTSGAVVMRVLVGRRLLYFAYDSANAGKNAPGLPDTRPVLSDSPMGYDFALLVTCVDGATGERLWTRRMTGAWWMAVDPKGDDLYLWREKVLRLAAKTGEVAWEMKTPGNWRQVKALRRSGRVLEPARYNPYERGALTRTDVLDVETGAVQEMDLVAPRRLAPDETSRLQLSTDLANQCASVLKCVSLDGSKTLWECRHTGYSGNEPIWLEDDVVWLAGWDDGRAETVRLDGRSGQVKWRFHLPRGAFVADRFQLRDGSYAWGDWNALGLAADRVLAVGQEGRIFLLDPKTGGLAAAVWPARAYLAAPQVIEGALVVAGPALLRAIPLDVAFSRRPWDERHVRTLAARCHVRLGDLAEARRATDRVLQRDPLFAEAWLLRAELARLEHGPQAEIAARCRWLDLSGRTESPELRRDYGLLRRIATGEDIRADLLPVGHVLYAGTVGGRVLALDTRSLDVIHTQRLGHAIHGMALRTYLGTHAAARGDDRREHTLSAPPERTEPEKAPDAWWRMHGDEQAVQWRGKWYRWLRGGSVRVLDGDAVEEFKGAVAGIGQWMIALDPDGPFGFGDGGVYTLDEHLAPASRLIEVRIPGPEAEAAQVQQAARFAGTIALFVQNRNGAVLQVWSADGKRLIRSEPTERMRRYFAHLEAARLTPLGGGYLLSATELVWVPASAEGPVWRFGVPADARAGRSDHLYPYFGVPVVMGGRLFVSARDGGIYVFEAPSLKSVKQ